jgi:hypothetical protein
VTSHRHRRYTDLEVRRLFRRAAELENEEAPVPAIRDGPTLEELEAIATEAGIDPGLVRRAARELDAAPAGRPRRDSGGAAFLGAPLSFELERVVEGEAPDTALERLLPLLQQAADGMGQPSLIRRTLTWQSTDPQKARTLQVSVTVHRGRTRLLLEERYGGLAGGLFGGIVGGVGGGIGLGVGLGVGIGALGSALFATLFPMGVFGGAYALARTVYRGTVHGRIRILRRLMEEMVALVEEGVADETGPEGPEPSLPSGGH